MAVREHFQWLRQAWAAKPNVPLQSRPKPLQDTSIPPLFRLPPELRDEIWSYVLGDHTIHITNPTANHITHTICISSIAEEDALTSPDRRLSSYSYRHSACSSLGWRSSPAPDQQLNLSLIRVSRACYEEVGRVFWTSTLFLFTHLHTFEDFLEDRTARQKGWIKKVGIKANQPLSASRNTENGNKKGRRLYDDGGWSAGLSELIGLDTLFLTCQLNFSEDVLGNWWINEKMEVDSLPLMSVARQLPLKRVNVNVDMASDYQYLKGKIELDREKRARLSNCIEVLMLRKEWPSDLSREEIEVRKHEWDGLVEEKREAVRRNPTSFTI